jgi:hypothetical protein
VVRQLMMEQHKQMIRDLMQGKLDLQNAPHEAAYQSTSAPKPEPIEVKQTAAPAEAPPPPPPPAPPQEEEKEQSLDDIILGFLDQAEKDR